METRKEVGNVKTVEETIAFIRQCVAGRCDRLDLLAIYDAINATQGMQDEIDCMEMLREAQYRE